MADSESAPTGSEERGSEGSTLGSVAKIGGVALAVGAAVAGGVLAGQRLFSGRGGDAAENDGDTEEAMEPTADVSESPESEDAGEADVAAGVEDGPEAAGDNGDTNEPGDEERAAANADTDIEADADEDSGPEAEADLSSGDEERAEANADTDVEADAEEDSGPQGEGDVGSGDDGDGEESIDSLSNTLKEAAVAAAVAGARAASEVFTDRTGRLGDR